MIPGSNLKKAIAQILLDEGYISRFEFTADDKQGMIKVTLKYAARKNVIKGIKRISKPGLRVYVDNENLPHVLGGLGIAIISTSKGIMTDKKARTLGVGGEVMAYVW
jgi:small subunit ribosomal protein S8